MNIKRVPCLAVIVGGPNRDRIVEVVRYDAEASEYFKEPTWFCRSSGWLTTCIGSEPTNLKVKFGVCQDRGLRPIDDPGEPETLTTREPQEATC